MAHCLSSSAAATSTVITWTNATPGFSGVRVWEYSFTGSAAALNAGATPAGTVSDGGTSATQPGVALTTTNTHNMVVIQNIQYNSTSVTGVSTYTNFSGTFGGTADLENVITTSPNVPTWTASGASIAAGNAIAFDALP
jgi:hypothetical protein